MRRTTRLTLPLVAFAAVASLLVGCAEGGAADAADEPDATDGPADAQPDDVVEIELVDFAFAGVPESVEAGTRLTITNESETELHEVVAFALPDDDDRPASALVELEPDDLLATLGDPVAVLLAAPGGEQIPAVGDGTLTDPGRYLLMCFIPTGADPQEYLEAAGDPDHEGPPQVDGGPPHFVHGMFTELLVE